MFHSWSFLSLLAVAATVAFIGVAGCGSSDKTCADARNTLFACGTKLGVSPSTLLGPNYATVDACIARCTNGGCPKVQQLVDCSAAVQCNNLAQVKTDVTACFTAASCSP